jgi:hypothetical protein
MEGGELYLYLCWSIANSKNISMKKAIILIAIISMMVSNVSGQAGFYRSIHPYPKTPFAGEFSLPRIKADIDSIAYLAQFVGGRGPYYTITRSDDGHSDMYWFNDDRSYYVIIRSYDEKDRLLSLVRKYTDSEQECDTLMLFSYDDQGRILKRKESFEWKSSYNGCFPDYFFMGIIDFEIVGGGSPFVYVTDYDYDNNTVKREYTYIRQSSGTSIDTIIRTYDSKIIYGDHKYTVITEGGEGEKDSTEYIFDSNDRLIQAGDVYYTYNDDGFTEKKGNVEYQYIFNEDGYLIGMGGENNPVSSYEWTYSQRTDVGNESISNITGKSKIIYYDGQLRVLFDDESLFDVAVYDMQGVLVTQSKSNKYDSVISLSGYEHGVYIVCFSSGNYRFSRKIVL